MISDIRDFYNEKIQTALTGIQSSAITTWAGDVSKPTADQTRVRLKVLPRETTNVGAGVNSLRDAGGLVQCDVIGPRKDGIDNVTVIAEAIINGISRGSEQLESGQLITYSVWLEGVSEEPAYLRVPVFIRWSYLH